MHSPLDNFPDLLCNHLLGSTYREASKSSSSQQVKSHAEGSGRIKPDKIEGFIVQVVLTWLTS